MLRLDVVGGGGEGGGGGGEGGEGGDGGAGGLLGGGKGTAATQQWYSPHACMGHPALKTPVLQQAWRAPQKPSHGPAPPHPSQQSAGGGGAGGGGGGVGGGGGGRGSGGGGGSGLPTSGMQQW